MLTNKNYSKDTPAVEEVFLDSATINRAITLGRAEKLHSFRSWPQLDIECYSFVRYGSLYEIYSDQHSAFMLKIKPHETRSKRSSCLR